MEHTALVTGASGGIGLELAKILSKTGWNLVLVARNADKLRTVQQELEQNGRKVVVYSLDLGQVDSCEELYSNCQRDGVSVELLINNAGFALNGPFHSLDSQETLGMIDLNVRALTHLTHLFLPQMLERKAGTVVNIASTAAFIPGPLMSVYYATKAYVRSFSYGLSGELEGTGVRCLVVCPGPTASGFQARANLAGTRMVQSGLATTEEVAKATYQAILEGKTEVIPGLSNKAVALLARLLPTRACAKIARDAQSKRTH